jgi:hypothetical protein
MAEDPFAASIRLASEGSYEAFIIAVKWYDASADVSGLVPFVHSFNAGTIAEVTVSKLRVLRTNSGLEEATRALAWVI